MPLNFFPNKSGVCKLMPLVALFLLVIVVVSGCATRKNGAQTMKYKQDIEEMMPIPYTPRDDGVPLTESELHAFKTVSDLDRNLSEEDARIVELHFKYFVHQKRGTGERLM